MKEGIHPNYQECTVTCNCGNTFKTCLLYTSEYDYKNTQWYQKAMENDGEPVFTDVYTDAIQGRPIITISQRSISGNAVLAFDIFPENLKFDFESIVLPEGGSYFLFDNTGSIIFEQTQSGEYMFKEKDFHKLFDSIQKGEHDTYDSRIKDFSMHT